MHNFIFVPFDPTGLARICNARKRSSRFRNRAVERDFIRNRTRFDRISIFHPLTASAGTPEWFVGSEKVVGRLALRAPEKELSPGFIIARPLQSHGLASNVRTYHYVQQ